MADPHLIRFRHSCVALSPTPARWLLLAGCVVLGALVGCRAREDAIPPRVPADLKIEAITGSLVPGEEDRMVEIGSNGSARFVRSSPSQPGSAPVAEERFTVSPDQLAQLWTAVQASDFFMLPAQHGRDDVSDGGFATLAVTADGRTHSVELRNTSVPAVENLIRVINDVTPPGKDLIYKPPPR